MFVDEAYLSCSQNSAMSNEAQYTLKQLNCSTRKYIHRMLQIGRAFQRQNCHISKAKRQLGIVSRNSSPTKP